jgi:asparagine synthase (glutamine-hydrolysing)
VCGITGLISRDGRPDESRVRRMNDALAHRGPDADGLWSRGRGALGHRRLSIIDLSPEATQPLLNEDGTIGVVVNGEIYNFVELREDLVRRGHVFRSHSDSEVVVHLYEEYGADCVAKLSGMFAFALWDSAQQRLLLARDRAGKKPLVYRRLPGGDLAFASEAHALVRAFPEFAVTPDLEAIDEYLTLQYVPAPRTGYRDVFKLPAAHLAVFERGELTLRRYWTKPSGPELSGSEEDLARELRDLLTRAVKRRLVADVPLGAFLSGGLDSSTIVALMATQSTRPVQTFSIGFPHASDSELGWARKVAARYGTVHHEAVVTPAMTDVVVETVRHHGEPFADSSAVAMYYLAKETRQHVTVALSGDGSDETLAGYTRYSTAQLAHVHDALPAPLRGVYRAGLRAVVRAAAPHVMGFADHLGDGEAVRYPYIMCQFSPEEKASLHGPAMRAASNGAQNATADRFKRVLAESGRASRLGRLIDLDWHTYLADDINAKVDIASMAHALEVRCPFMDTDVVEFTSRLPRRMLMRWRGKHLLRKAVADLVPAAILRRHKQGFGLPLRRWMKDDLGTLVRDVLLDRRARERGLFDPREVQRLVDSMDRDRNAPDRVWTLLVLELWFREFVDPPAS